MVWLPHCLSSSKKGGALGRVVPEGGCSERKGGSSWMGPGGLEEGPENSHAGAGTPGPRLDDGCHLDPSVSSMRTKSLSFILKHTEKRVVDKALKLPKITVNIRNSNDRLAHF